MGSDSRWSGGVIARFGRWTFDARRRLLRDGAEEVHLTPKAFDLLGVLLEQAPRVVRKAELHERLWPGTFVTDATLVGVVKELRRVLQDRSRRAPLIRTAYGIGYAFEGAVEHLRADRLAPPSSIAVLPFANLSGDARNDYLSSGLTEELIGALAQLPGLRVVSRTSAFQLLPESEDREPGRGLRVDLVLEGSVRRAGSRVRIAARLIETADGHHVWSDRYDREMADVFEIQDEITRSIVKALQPALTGQPPPAGARHRQNVEAFELYLRGRHRWYQRTPESVHTAIAHFEAATRLDPDYALAHAGLSDSYAVLAFFGYLPLEDARAAAEKAATRALALAPQLAESHYAMALYSMWLTPAWLDAERSFRRALDIQPAFAPAHTHYAAFLAIRRRFEEAEVHLREAMGLEPLSPAVFGTGALCMYTSGRFEEAIRFAERTLALHPGFALGFYTLGMAHCRTGRYEEGCDAFDRLLALSNRASYFVAWATLAHSLAGRRDQAAALAEEGARRHPSEYVYPLSPLLVAVAFGDRHGAAAALHDYVERGGSGFQVSHVLPFLPWAFEPPFAEMLDRLQLSPAGVTHHASSEQRGRA